MKKRLLLITLVIMLTMGNVMQSEVRAEAAATSAVTTYTAAKVLAALLALVGVVVEKSGVQLIWNGEGLNTDALIENMMTYDRYLGMQMKVLLANGAAGITTLTLNRRIWTSFKAWARQYFGVSIGTDNIFGTSETEVTVIHAGQPMNVSYSYTQNSTVYEGSYNVTFNVDMIAFLSYQQKSTSVYPWRYTIYYFPVTQVESWRDITYTISDRMGNDAITGYGTVYSSAAGYGVYNDLGFNDTYNFGMLVLAATAYMLGVNNGQTTLDMAGTKTQEFRTEGTLSQEEEVSAAPVEGVAGDAATADGEDVISYGNTVTQENEETVIDGGLTVALPAEDDLESLLADLAAGIITYKEYVEALGLQAVNTKTESLAEVQEKEQAITTDPVAGAYTVSLKDLFPFCIPFDLYNIVACFNAEPVAPSADITIPTSYDGDNFTWNTYTVSLEDFSPVAAVVRVLEYVTFVVGLMFVTRKLIEG